MFNWKRVDSWLSEVSLGMPLGGCVGPVAGDGGVLQAGEVQHSREDGHPR